MSSGDRRLQRIRHSKRFGFNCQRPWLFFVTFICSFLKIACRTVLDPREILHK